MSLNNMNKKTNKTKKKISDKTIMLTAAGFAVVMLLGFVGFIFKDSLFKDKPKNVNWGEISEEGDIVEEDSSENTMQKKEIVTDEKGLVYERVYFYSMGYSMYIPKDWKVTIENKDTVYIQSTNDTYRSMDIGIVARELKSQNLDTLQSNMLDFFRHNFVYHYYDPETKVTAELQDSDFVINTYTPEKIYDESQKVWIDDSNPSVYIEADSPDEVGNWKEGYKFLGIKEHGTFVDMSTETGNLKASPIYDFFYTFNGNTELVVTSTAMEDFSDLSAYTLDFIANSIEKIEELPEGSLPSFTKKYEIKDLTLKYPEIFTLNSTSKEMFSATCNDLNSSAFGISLTVIPFKYPEGTTMTTDMYQDKYYKYQLFNAYTLGSDVGDIFNQIDEVVLAFNKIDTTTIAGKEAESFETNLSLQTLNSEIYVKTNLRYPISALTYLIQDKDENGNGTVYMVNISYGNSQKEVAEKYARAFIKTLTIS